MNRKCCCCECKEIDRLERYIKLLEHTNETLFEQKMRYYDVTELLETKLPPKLRRTLEDIGFWKNNEQCMRLIREGKLVLD